MERFLKVFEVPEVAEGVIGRIVNGDEIAFIEAVGAENFTTNDAVSVFERLYGGGAGKRVTEFLKNAYRRGVISLLDESFTRFRVGTFYERLDLFAITETGKYRELSEATRSSLDEWYFGAYLNGLGNEPRPTGDRVVTLEQTLNCIDNENRRIWLNRCDCRLLAGNCGKPVDTCITFRSGINTMQHRGWSKPLSKEQAKNVIRRANAAGLMQTVNPNGICNCCGDCCYLFRAQKARAANPVWPLAKSIAAFDVQACIACGICVRRCNFGAFRKENGKIDYDAGLCRGCGLCSLTCRPEAIKMIRRNTDEYGA